MSALVASGYRVICMGAAGSVSGTQHGKTSCSVSARAGEYTDVYVTKLQEELNISFIALPMTGDGTNPLSDMRLLYVFYKTYKKYRPVTVLHFNNKPNIYGSLAAALCKIPVLNNITGLGVVAEKKHITAKIVYTLYKIAFASPYVFVFFQNKDDRIFFLEHKLIPENKTGLLPGSGVDTSRFAPAIIQDDCRTPFHPVHFLFNGRLLISKGIRHYIQAAAEIKKIYPSVIFEIIGELEDNNSIFIPVEELNAVVQAGIVIWHGLVSNVIPYIQHCDCSVLPSYYREGVPRGLLEAAAMGKALIAADSPGTREPVENNINGFLIEPCSTESLVCALRSYIELSDEKKQMMGAASRRLAEERFSDTIVIDSYLRQITVACHQKKEEKHK